MKINELVQANSGAEKISLISQKSLPEGTGLALLQLMGEAQALKPNQTLSELTQDVYLSEWEKLALKYGLVQFRDALSKAMSESSFFPDPAVIAELCAMTASSNRSRNDAQKAIAEHDASKAQWERENRDARAAKL